MLTFKAESESASVSGGKNEWWPIEGAIVDRPRRNANTCL